MADDTPDTPATEQPTPRRRAAPRKATGKPKKPAAAAATDVAATAERKTRTTRSRAASRPAAQRKTGGDTARTRKAPAKKASTATPRARKEKSTIDRATDAVGGRLAAAAIGAVAAAGATVAAVLTLRGSSARNVGTAKKPIDISGSGDKGKGHPQTVHTDGSHQPGNAGAGAHQPDGTDSSASFNAGIADENTVPNKR